MEHHGFDWTGDEDGQDGNAETADLGGDDLGNPDLGGHDLGGFGDFGESDLGGTEHDLGGADLGGHDLGGHDAGGLEEPLGTENAAATFDASVGHEGEFDDPFGGHDPGGDPGDSGDPGDPGDSGDAGGEAGLHEAHDGGDPGDGPGDGGPGDDGGVDLVGGDPHLDHTADDPGWDDQPFPPDLGITDPPEPVDGFPWSDPAALGTDGGEPDDYVQTLDGSFGDGADTPADLAAYDGVEVPPGVDAWTALLGSEDPATSALARWWAPS